MTRSEAFTAICDCLRARLLDKAPAPPLHGPQWELLVEASSHHLVTPALAWALQGRTDLPRDISGYLDAVLALNGDRNEQLLTTLTRVAATLNATGARPMLIKGAARLAEGLYPSPNLRILGDLDILVPEDRAAAALAALQAAGFRYEDGAKVNPDLHHLPMLFEPGTGVGIELHSKLMAPPCDALLPAARVWARARQALFRDQPVYLPDFTSAVVHNVAHSQLQDGNDFWRRVQLRQLLDLILLRARHGAEIDWSEIDRTFCEAGHGTVLATYLELARALFGQPAPPLREQPRPAAVDDFYRSVERPRLRRWANIARLPLQYLAARWRHPSGVLRLFNLKTWPDRIQLLLTRFKTNW